MRLTQEEGVEGMQGKGIASQAFVPGSSALRNPPAMNEALVRFLGREDLLEKGSVTHSNIPAWRIS